jgi:short-subunit dehydrogenase
MFYQDKIVWIVGASSGIGKATAIEFSKQKAKIIISSRNESKLNIVKSVCEKNGAECFVLPLDLTQINTFNEKVDKVISKFHIIDVLIINGGISQRSLIKDTGLDIDRKIMEIDYFGNIAITKAVLPFMIKQQHGQIATVSSIVGVFGFPLRSAYSAAKHALHGFYETLRAEHKQDNINVSVIIPGRVKTNVSINAIDNKGKIHNELDEGQADAISSEKCAKILIKGLSKNKKEILIGGKELLMVYFRRYLPFVFYRIVTKIKST